MLIQFSVKNFRSINDEAELQLTTQAGKEHVANNTFHSDAKGADAFGLMKSAVIYGPNSAGKSNLIKALSKMQWLVEFSATKLQVGSPLYIEPFKFSESTTCKPTEFNSDFISEGIRYQYGFAATNERIVEEWLFAYPNGRAQTWFIREYDPSSKEYNWTKDAYLTGSKTVWKNATRENALYLSTAIQLNNEQLIPVYQWFTRKLRVINTNDLNYKYTARKIMTERQSSDDVLAFLKAGDLGIEDVKVRRDGMTYNSKNDMVSEAPIGSSYGRFLEFPVTSTSFNSELIYNGDLAVKTGHRMENGSLHYLDLKDESDGTQRMFSLAAPLVEGLQDGAVIFIDELNNSLHPTMVKFLVSLFNSAEENPNNAQLIFTTHETSILSQDVFRRDQIWFCEKNKAQSTSLYSLSDFKVRKGADNIERNYLSGKYGALPFIDKTNLGELNG